MDARSSIRMLNQTEVFVYISRLFVGKAKSIRAIASLLGAFGLSTSRSLTYSGDRYARGGGRRPVDARNFIARIRHVIDMQSE